MRADAGVHAHRHLGPGLAGQRDQPVDPRSPPSRVALRHLPHADQRVAPAPQHQLLQVPGQRPVTLPHRLEDPPAQPPYLPLMMTPVRLLPGIRVKRGRPSGPFTKVSNLPIGSGIRARFAPKAHLAASAPFQARHQAGIRPVIRAPSGRRPRTRGAAFLLPFGRRPSLLSHPVPPRDFRPPYGRPTAPPAHTRACTADPGEVSTFRTHETRTGPGALYTPGTAVSAGHRWIRGRRLPPLNGRSLPPRHYSPARDVGMTRHQQGFPGSRPSGPSPHLWPPWLARRPLGFPVSSAPSRPGTGHARHGGDRSNTNP